MHGLSRHCERSDSTVIASAAKQSSFERQALKDKLDCFVASLLAKTDARYAQQRSAGPPPTRAAFGQSGAARTQPITSYRIAFSSKCLQALHKRASVKPPLSLLMRPPLLNPLFAPVTSLAGVGPKQDR